MADGFDSVHSRDSTGDLCCLDPIGETMNFENDSFYISPENTTLEEQNETMHIETGTLLPDISGTGEWAGSCEAGRLFPQMDKQDC